MFFKKVGASCGINTYIGYPKQNDVRILAAPQKCSSSYRKCCQQLRQRKRKDPDTASYISGAFSTKKQLDISNKTDTEEKIASPLLTSRKLNY